MRFFGENVNVKIRVEKIIFFHKSENGGSTNYTRSNAWQNKITQSKYVRLLIWITLYYCTESRFDTIMLVTLMHTQEIHVHRLAS